MARSSATAAARSAVADDDAPLRPSGALPSVDDSDDVESRIYRAVFESVMNQRLTAGTKLPEGSFDCMARGDAAGAVQLMDEHLRQLERNVSVKRAEPERTLAHLLGMA